MPFPILFFIGLTLLPEIRFARHLGGLTSYTNQLGSNVVNCAYDALGRKTNEVNPGITTNNYAYCQRRNESGGKPAV